MELFQASFLVFLFLFGLFFHFLFYRQKTDSNLQGSLPPGKNGLPVVGDSLEYIFHGWKGHPEKFIFDRMAKFSSNVFRTSLFGSPTVVFCGAAANKFLFSNDSKLVRPWFPSNSNKIFPLSAQTSRVELSIRFRKMLPNFLKAEALQGYVGIMDGIGQRHFSTYWENKDQLVALPLTKRYTFWIACRLFISLEDPCQVAIFEDPFGVLASGVLSLPIDFPGTPLNRAIKASNFLRSKIFGIIKQRKLDLAEGKASPIQDLLSHMLLTNDEDGKFMLEGDIATKILTMLVASHETSSSACASIVKFLAELPDVYEGVYREQMEIAKSKAPGELLNWSDIQKMKYSWNVACEAMRLAPPLRGAFKEAINDIMYNGFSIPKGSKIHWSVHATHRNAEFFPEPLKFDPSRFEGSGPAPYSFVPFGGGPRMCPGKEYARLEILVFMHHVVRRFKWEKIIPNEKIIVNPMSIPEKGLPIRLFPHKA